MPIAATLASAVNHEVEAPLVRYIPGKQWLPIEMPAALNIALGGPVHVHKLRLSIADPTRLLIHPELRFTVATYNTSPRLVRARIRFVGTTCTYETPPGTRFPNNGPLPLVRSRTCVPLHGAPTGEIDFDVTFDGAGGRAALWTFTPAPGVAEGDPLYVSDPHLEASALRPQVMGEYVDYVPGPRTSRVALLAYMWQLGSTPWWIWTVLVLVALTLYAGIRLLPFDLQPGATPPRRIVRTSAGVLLIFGAIASLYAVLAPPFQAPDEPSHFLGFAQLARRPDILADAEPWGRLTHFQRLRFDPTQRFRPADIGHPYAETWDMGPMELSARSGVILEWRIAAKVLSRASAQKALAALRVGQAWGVAIAAALGVAVVLSSAEVAAPPLAAAALLAVPMVPFFSMHVSNHAVLLAGYVLIAFGTLTVFLDGRRSYLAGVLFGLGILISCSVSRSGIPILPLVAAMGAAHLVVGTREVRDRSLVAPLVFWGSLGLGTALVPLVTSPEYFDSLTEPLTRLPPALKHPNAIAVAGSILLAAALAALAERAAGRVRSAAAPWRPACTAAMRAIAWLATAAVACSFAGSLIWSYPRLRLLVLLDRPAVGQYLREAFLGLATIFRLRDHDTLLSTSFVAAFGWLERIPPEPFITTLVVCAAAALLVLLHSLARARAVRQATILGFAAAGSAMSFAAYAALTWVSSRDIQGRYLDGLYLVMLTLAFSPLATQPAWRLHSRVSRTSLVLAACAIVHAIALGWLMTSYF